ncbi:protein OSCP1-like [Clytia hemisphaerica]|uniref:protein OSCP1-like n=1 Tax=Clytia hemisphaerica TaxID=252671 RepID=UPI0034D72EBA|eukprot:TCONS_00071294-protein
MSLKTLPVLFLNLGGEMMYILDQRLNAQNIPPGKAKKVMHDILATMLNKRFMEELFKPQDAYSRKAMRTVFDRLAHASIMRLNSASMDKLYDLMTMALKYQVSLSKQPQDVLMVTLNHMDTIREYSRGNSQILEQVDYVYSLINEAYSTMTPGEFQLIRQTLLNFFQDMHIRVSIFLKDKVQTPNGRFILPKGGKVPWGSETPGVIRFYNDQGEQANLSSFFVEGKYQLPDKPGSFEILGDRGTRLGVNMYTMARPVETSISTTESVTSKPSIQSTKSEADDVNNTESAKAELNLLNHLLAGANKDSKDFRLNLFDSDAQEQVAEKQYAKVRHREVVVDATQRSQRSEITQLMNEFSIESSGAGGDKGDDLLALMDST